MVQLNQAFDSNQHDDMDNFEAIPAAVYQMQVTKSDLCDTKDKTGKYIKLELTVLSGEYQGRKIWMNLNIVNANPKAVEIAQKTLATICRTCGKPVIQDTQEIHGIPMNVTIKVKPASGVYPPSNAPSGFEPLGSTKMPVNKTKTSIPTKNPNKVKKPVVQETEAAGPDVGDGENIPWGK